MHESPFWAVRRGNPYICCPSLLLPNVCTIANSLYKWYSFDATKSLTSGTKRYKGQGNIMEVSNIKYKSYRTFFQPFLNCNIKYLNIHKSKPFVLTIFVLMYIGTRLIFCVAHKVFKFHFDFKIQIKK